VSVPVWAAELAGAFWREAGVGEPFPRCLLGPITRALPVGVIDQAGLCLRAIRDRLARGGIIDACDAVDRPLRACLVARWGFGLIFIDAADAEDERRFSLAHELAHFLRDYWRPRRLAVDRLGGGVLEVLDGRRPASAEERLTALLTRVPVGCHWHLMHRDDTGQASPAVRAAERDADRLAYELLAPATDVLTRAGDRGRPTRLAVVGVLEVVFGLPAAQARDYGAILIPEAPADPLLRRLGFRL
jgi:hypothetical protein